jgi:hypothetical protein
MHNVSARGHCVVILITCYPIISVNELFVALREGISPLFNAPLLDMLMSCKLTS